MQKEEALSLYEILKKTEWFLIKLLNILLFFKTLPNYLLIKKDIHKNLLLKNKEKGKICYILLGGLSAKNIDLKSLSEFDIITVNHFFRTSENDLVKPKYHIITDPNFYEKNQNITDLIQNGRKDTEFILNGRYFKNEESIKNIHLFFPVYKVTNSNIKFEINKRCSLFSTVTLNAIQIASYLGYQEINLIGFDLPPGVMPHFYRESSVEKDGFSIQKKAQREYEYCKLYWAYTNCLHESYSLQRALSAKNIKIFNMSKDSYVRAFPFKNFEKI